MKPHTAFTLAALAAVTLVIASGPHTSASYTVQPAVLDGGGARATSVSYTNTGSVLDIEGTGSAGVYTAGHGFIAQLVTDPAGCPVFIVPYGYNEGEDVQGIDCDAIVASLEEAARRVASASAVRP